MRCRQHFLGVSEFNWKELADYAEEEMMDVTPGCHLLGVHPHSNALSSFLAGDPLCSIHCVYLETPIFLLNPAIPQASNTYTAKYKRGADIYYYPLYTWIKSFLSSSRDKGIVEKDFLVPIYLPPIYQAAELSAIVSLMADYLYACKLPPLTKEELLQDHALRSTAKEEKILLEIGDQVAKVYRSLL